MTLHDYRDWNRVLQHAGAATFNDQRAWQAPTFILPAAFVGDADTLIFRATTGLGGLNITLTQAVDQSLGTITAQTTWDCDQQGVVIADVVPVMGNWARIDGSLTNTTAGNTTTIEVVPVVGSPTASVVNGRGDIMQIIADVLAGGATRVYRPTQVSGGKAKWNISTTATTWNAILTSPFSGGTAGPRIYIADSAVNAGGRAQVDLYLPRGLLSVSVTNFDAGNQTFWTSLVLGP